MIIQNIPYISAVRFSSVQKAQGVDWKQFKGDEIPSSLELDPVIFAYIGPDSKILDVGCGYGKTVFELYRAGFQHIKGTDINQSGLDFAEQASQKLGLNPAPVFVPADANQLPYSDQTFDAVVTQAFWTAIGVDDRPVIMAELNRVLKPGGVLYLKDFAQTWSQTKYRKRYENGLSKGLDRGSFEARNDAGKLEYIAHHYTKKELELLLRKAGFKLEAYSKVPVTTRTGSHISGHVIIARKR